MWMAPVTMSPTNKCLMACTSEEISHGHLFFLYQKIFTTKMAWAFLFLLIAFLFSFSPSSYILLFWDRISLCNLDGLELNVQTMLASNLWALSCPCFLSAGIKGTHHRTGQNVPSPSLVHMASCSLLKLMTLALTSCASSEFLSMVCEREMNFVIFRFSLSHLWVSSYPSTFLL